MSLEQLGRFLIIIAVVLAVAGALVLFVGRGLGLARLPGDIFIKRDHWGIFIPIATSIMLSIILTVVINVILWLIRR